ncbi:MAG: D-alanyl-D-alanine carboxypeptidase [Treponema sp.]|nr:D-alanyl-D-alanine carboxypeptidase [Treponema sp.]
MSEKNTGKKGGKARWIVVTAVLVVLLLWGSYLLSEAKRVVGLENLGSLTATQKNYMDSCLDIRYPERLATILAPLPYAVEPPELDLAAECAILVDTATGSIIYEQNADELVPPASLTKIVEMYVIFQAVQKGDATLDEQVPLPPQSWAVNLPSDASRMGLSEGEHVTLRELLLGLAIASGNDASIACAYHIAGSMEEFVRRMNAAVQELGLEKTHFVESSGYSAENVTTAREFATFATAYIKKFPFALREFHSRESLSYPLRRNLSQAELASGRNYTYTQKNTNKLLGQIKGCDGLKTGFIEESGYNISVTAEQNGTRFLAVTLRGPGSGTAEGNKYRVQDNIKLFNYAFSSFADYHGTRAASDGSREHAWTVAQVGGKGGSVRLVPALDETFTVPILDQDSPTAAASSVYVTVEIPDMILGEIRCGDSYGTIRYWLDDRELRALPLVADRDAQGGNIFEMVSGRLLMFVMAKAKELKK